MADVKEEELVDQGALPPDDFHENIERILEIAEYELEIPSDLLQRLDQETETLLVDQSVKLAAAAALSVGHLVLQGPPGTGKSSLARALGRVFRCELFPVTAHEDWSTFDVIGRQELRVNAQGQEEVVPTNGFFTEAAIRCAGTVVRHFDDPVEPQATWLLIDELNRAHLDKAFGELFTLLGTDESVTITLPHQREGNRELATPRRFRLIATLNSVDKQFVNSLSQALRRRFTFITLDIPPQLGADQTWENDSPNASLAQREFALVVRRAVQRVAKRISPPNNTKLDIAKIKQNEIELLSSQAHTVFVSLFDLVTKVRYAKENSQIPHLPIGTAQIIDTIELFLTRVYLEKTPQEYFSKIMDWAASVKLAPLFDADTINVGDLQTFAGDLQSPFDILMRKELLQIISAGLYYVE